MRSNQTIASAASRGTTGWNHVCSRQGHARRSAAVTDALSGPIHVRWLAPFRLGIEVEVAALRWELDFRPSLLTAAFGLARRFISDGTGADLAAPCQPSGIARLGDFVVPACGLLAFATARFK